MDTYPRAFSGEQADLRGNTGETAEIKNRPNGARRDFTVKEIDLGAYGAGDRDRTGDIQLGKLTFCSRLKYICSGFNAFVPNQCICWLSMRRIAGILRTDCI